MNILVVCSGNSSFGISPIIKNQVESLINNNINVDFYLIKGKGVRGYLSNIPLLYKFLKKNHYDVVHAHYSLSAIVATLAGASPLVVSLMGSDVESSKLWHFILNIFHKFFWKATIVKSESMKQSLGIDNVYVIPNGVNFNLFKPIEKKIALEKVKFNPNKKHILFLANPSRKEKNYKLAKSAFDRLSLPNTELNVVYNISHNLVPYYINASDVVLLTSLWEGSPNIIKEAMACNTPIVSTDVGDVKKVIDRTEGCFLTDFSEKDVSEKLLKAINFGKKTNGRKNIAYLDENVIAKKIISIYQKIGVS